MTTRAFEIETESGRAARVRADTYNLAADVAARLLYGNNVYALRTSGDRAGPGYFQAYHGRGTSDSAVRCGERFLVAETWDETADGAARDEDA